MELTWLLTLVKEEESLSFWCLRMFGLQLQHLRSPVRRVHPAGTTQGPVRALVGLWRRGRRRRRRSRWPRPRPRPHGRGGTSQSRGAREDVQSRPGALEEVPQDQEEVARSRGRRAGDFLRCGGGRQNHAVVVKGHTSYSFVQLAHVRLLELELAYFSRLSALLGDT